MVGNSGIYGQHAAKKYGVIFSEDAITDGAAATLTAQMGQIVIDGTDGKISYVDSSGLTQELS